MKKLRILAISLLILGATAPAFSIVQFGAQGNYINDTFSNGGKNSGVGFGGFGRLTVGIPLLITVAGGGYFDYGTLTSNTTGGSDAKQLRAGAEAALYLDVIGNLIGLTPYARFGFGYEGNTSTVTVGTSSADLLYYGTGGHTLFGLAYKVLPMVYLFGEGGVQWSSLKASVPDVLKTYSSSFNDITAQGWRASIGAMLWI